MTADYLIQLIASLVGCFGFGILFNMRKERLGAVCLGGFLSWGLFLLLYQQISNEPLCYFLVAAMISMYSEIMARRLKTPAAPIATVSLIPLVPGGSLYYTMASAFESDFNVFLSKAVYTLQLASALALGIIVVTFLSRFIFKPYRKVA